MSTLNESVARRVTLGYLASHYGFDLQPSFVSAVTITSLANDVDSVRPGSLYIPMGTVDEQRLAKAQENGAYAALVPTAFRSVVPHPDFPLLFADPTPQQLGRLASDVAGAPAAALAVFAIAGNDDGEIQLNVMRLADVLHMLGNPVGVISAEGSKSLERQLNLTYPLNMLDVQHTLAVCSEDGAAAVVIAMDGKTLKRDSLQEVSVDVLGTDENLMGGQAQTMAQASRSYYGFAMDKQEHVTTRTEESNLLASQTSLVYDKASERHLSLSIAMVLAAGVRRSNIKGALRVSRELH
ncbi:MAG: UDP-N-acetylmuramyl peptide synthase [Bifidobacterium sp.]|jgi:UDP-N-acetylmuramyl tripeptide synthase|nr:UDP-N-acetylmuramyl peptide synthase [Bifidobacterium sp.]